LKMKALSLLWEFEKIKEKDWEAVAKAFLGKITDKTLQKEIDKQYEKKKKWFNQLDYTVDALQIMNWERAKFYLSVYKGEADREKLKKYFDEQQKKWLFTENVSKQLKYLLKLDKNK
jgi:hypothetical protein